MKNLKQILLLISLMVGSSAFAKAEKEPAKHTETVATDWTGTWNTSFGQVILNQKDKYVVGTYRELGTIRAITNSSGTLTAVFDNNGKEGYLQWTQSGNSFSGKWGWTRAMEQGAWTGTKTTDAAQNYIKGKWTTQYGELDFINSKTGMMAAHYGNTGGMIWGKMNHSTKIFTGNYKNTAGAKTETCSFIFTNTTFKGKFNNREYGSWNGQRKTAHISTAVAASSTADSSTSPIKFKITLNSFKCHQSDNVRKRERGRVQVLFALENNDGYKSPLNQSSASMFNSSRWYFLFKERNNKNYVEGQSISVNSFVTYPYSGTKFKTAPMHFVFTESVGLQTISEVKNINVPQIISFLKGETSASDYPLVPGHDGRRRISNTQDSFWLETIGGKRIARGYSDVKDRDRGKIHFGYHYTIELVD